MKKLLFILLGMGCGLVAMAQTGIQPSESDSVPAKSGKQTMVYLENAETLTFDQARHPDAQVLTGNVRFRHDDALMFCDSAYFYEKSNSLDAFGHVRFEQGDTLFGYADKLFYDGNRKFAKMRQHVRLVDKTTTLTTDSLNYDRQADKAWYFSGGELKDDMNTLTSGRGTYISHLDQADFRWDVHLVNDKFVLDADTLKYNTKSHVADMLGSTTIVYQEETTIYSTKGWYNTETEKSMLLERSRIEHVDGNTMTGDTIYYDKKLGFGRTIGNFVCTDSSNHVTLYGNYSEMYEDGPDGKNSGFATDSALVVDWSDSVNYTYIHSDTLYIAEKPFSYYTLKERDSLLVVTLAKDSVSYDSVMTWQAPDTIWQDSTYRLIRAMWHVRTYREDMQSVADSAIYNSKDSILFLYGNPIAWSDEQQVSADKITVYMKNDAVDRAHGEGNALAVQEKWRKRFYNQLAGKELVAYIRDGELRELNVSGNVETVFFPQEEDNGGAFIGVNRTQSSYCKIFVKEQKVERVLFTTSTTGIMYPFSEAGEKEMKLSGFFWAEGIRPKNPGDVFRVTDENVRPEKKAMSAAAEDNEDNNENDNDKKDAKKQRNNSRQR